MHVISRATILLVLFIRTGHSVTLWDNRASLPSPSWWIVQDKHCSANWMLGGRAVLCRPPSTNSLLNWSRIVPLPHETVQSLYWKKSDSHGILHFDHTQAAVFCVWENVGCLSVLYVWLEPLCEARWLNKCCSHSPGITLMWVVVSSSFPHIFFFFLLVWQQWLQTPFFTYAKVISIFKQWLKSNTKLQLE